MENNKVVGLRACFVGGNANNGAVAGLAYVNSNNALSNSNANIGSRICGNNNKRRPRPCLLAKKHKTIAALVALAKERLIHKLPYYPDRIVHHAIMNVVEPIWVGRMTADTYANIKGRGIHKCAEKLKHTLYVDPKGTFYCLQLDIKKYYPSIDHEIMKAEVRLTIKDERLLALIDEIIDSCEGLPIGNYLSQYLANLYLSRFDHRIKEVHHVRHYFPIRGRHGVSRGKERRASTHLGNRSGRNGGFALATQTELADIPSGRERDRLPRLCVFPRIHAFEEKHQEKDVPLPIKVKERENHTGSVREINGFLARVA